MKVELTINLPHFYKKCPQNMTDADCPLFKYLHYDNQQVFYVCDSLVNGIVLTPYQHNFRTCIDVLQKMNRICDKCKKDNKQKTK